MRDARFVDFQRRLRISVDARRPKLTRFYFEGITTLGTGEFAFQSPITVLTGPNGVGKTTLLRAIHATLSGEAGYLTAGPGNKLSSGRASLDLVVNTEDLVAAASFETTGFTVTSAVEVPSLYVDAATESRAYQGVFCDFSALDDIINGAGPTELSPDDLNEINYILGREYRAITLYEVDVGGVAPFFEVAYGDDRYDSRTMGSGELTGLHLWWSLSRVDSGTIVLIEEPEAFLSHASQANLARHIVAAAVKRGITVIASTHSAPIISQLPRECHRFFVRSPDGIKFIGEPTPPALLKSLGVSSPIIAILFVEDMMAAALTRAIVEKIAPSFARQLKIVVRDGHGGVTNALRGTDFEIDYPKFIGVYDGDVRSEVPNDLASRAIFLPGTERIERIFRRISIEQPGILTPLFPAGGQVAVLSSLEGQDDHDWFANLAVEANIHKLHLFNTFFTAWAASDEVSAEMSAMYGSLAAILGIE